jgi:hypothetical protein
VLWALGAALSAGLLHYGGQGEGAGAPLLLGVAVVGMVFFGALPDGYDAALERSLLVLAAAMAAVALLATRFGERSVQVGVERPGGVPGELAGLPSEHVAP